MATRGQTHNKRAREMALRDKRERKAAKKEDRAAGLLPVYDDEGFLVEPVREPDIETAVETGVETPVAEETESLVEAIQ